MTVTLVDGTQLTLAPASRVRLTAGYGEGGRAGGSKTGPYNGAREVELEGEAYFAVAHDAARPFAVRAHGAVARDIGTAFDVRAYPEDSGVRIAVAEGTVAVSAPVAATVREQPLQAGDVATVAQSGIAVEHGMDVARLAGWTAGRLTFAHTPLREVATELSRWYGVPVRLGDQALGNQPVLATFTQSNVAEALEVLAPAAGATVIQDEAGNGYTLVPVRGLGPAR